MEKIDFSVLSIELIVSFRGRLSQQSFNKQLGFRSNKVHRWETGELTLSWKDLCLICKIKEISLSNICAKTFSYTGDVDEPSLMIKHLLGDRPQEQLAKKLGVSRSMISRWRSGHIIPSLPIILQLIELSYYSSSEFIIKLAGITGIPSIRDTLVNERREALLHSEHPWVAALIMYLATSEYQAHKVHPDGFLAKKLGITLAMEIYALQELVATHTIILKDSLYFITRETFLNSKQDFESNMKIRAYWLERTLKLMKTMKQGENPKNLFGYMVFAVNEAMLDQLWEKHVQFYQDVLALMGKAGDAELDKAVLLNLNIINIENLP